VVIVNGFLAVAQQILATLHAKGLGMWQVLSAIAANRPLPARDVIIYTAVFAVLLTVIAPKILKKVTK
jgi:6-phosphogluconate dehydrogenase